MTEESSPRNIGLSKRGGETIIVHRNPHRRSRNPRSFPRFLWSEDLPSAPDGTSVRSRTVPSGSGFDRFRCRTSDRFSSQRVREPMGVSPRKGFSSTPRLPNPIRRGQRQPLAWLLSTTKRACLKQKYAFLGFARPADYPSSSSPLASIVGVASRCRRTRLREPSPRGLWTTKMQSRCGALHTESNRSRQAHVGTSR